IGQHLIKRLIAAVRNSRHGGTMVVIPPDLAQELLEEDYVSLKYKFTDNEPRRRFRSLIVRTMNAIAELRGDKIEDGDVSEPVGWEYYEAGTDEKLANLDEAIFEVGHLIAGLTAVDGAFVMTQRFELLGFGGEISGNLPDISIIEKALDAEGSKTVKETTTGVGTRHRSAYRLAGALPRALVVVVSQDGNVRFVKRKDGYVTYWDQA
ncbi:MAG: putative sensor domain DACNV-containing protein, partial [Rubrobacteraceae bacterium]